MSFRTSSRSMTLTKTLISWLISRTATIRRSSLPWAPDLSSSLCVPETRAERHLATTAATTTHLVDKWRTNIPLVAKKTQLFAGSHFMSSECWWHGSQKDMLPWWPSLELLSQCPIFGSSHSNSRSGTCRFHPWSQDLPMSCKDLSIWQGTRIVAPAMATRWSAPLFWQ